MSAQYLYKVITCIHCIYKYANYQTSIYHIKLDTVFTFSNISVFTFNIIATLTFNNIAVFTYSEIIILTIVSLAKTNC